MAYDWKSVPQDLINDLPESQCVYAQEAHAGTPLSAIAAKYEVSERTVTRALAKARIRIANAGWSPTFDATRFVDPGQRVRGKSTLTKDDEGNTVWIKTDTRLQDLQTTIAEFVDGMKGQIKPVKATKPPAAKDANNGLMSKIFIGDAHIGMRAWSKETKGADFDTDIATGQIRDAIGYLVDKADPCEYGVLVDVGDFTHSDSSKDQTYKGTPVDMDTRHSKVMYEAARVMCWSIDLMLKKFQKVIVIITPGNHNTDTSRAIRMALSFRYENEPRVTIPENHGFSIYLEWGKWLFGYNHGDKIKPADLVGCMAQDMSTAWGRTRHRMWCTGHYHQRAVTNFKGCEHRVFAALPPADGWHSSMGYGGHGIMEMLTFKKEGGLHSSYTYTIDMPVIEPDVAL